MAYIPKDMAAMWDGGETQRFHTMPMLRPDTVGQHSYGVACVLMHVFPKAPARLLRAALKHDMAEAHYGDMPSPAKRELGIREQFAQLEDSYLAGLGVEPEELAPWEQWLLNFCDIVEGLRVTVRERAMGNQLIWLARRNFQDYAEELLAQERCVNEDIYERCKGLAWALKKEWEIVSK